MISPATNAYETFSSMREDTYVIAIAINLLICMAIVFAYDKIAIIFIVVLSSIYNYIATLGCETITYHIFKDKYSTYCSYLMGLLLTVI